MSVSTLQGELDAINGAIAAILEGGQEVEAGTTRLRNADLATLYRRRDQLEARLARATRGGGIRVRGATPV